MRTIIAVCLLLSLVVMIKKSYAECAEYKIIDHGDSKEAVCVGQPLNEAEKKELVKQIAQQEEKDKRNALIECYGSLDKYNKIPGERERQTVLCQKIQIDLNIYLASKPVKLVDHSTTTNQFDNSAGLAAIQGQMEAQRAAQQMEMQRQQAEMQRMQQQQRFNQIWNK